MKPGDVETFFRALLQKMPDPKIELIHTNPFTLLIATVLSAQSTDKQVNKITPPIFEKVQTPQQLLDLGPEWFREKISSINYNNTKAANIMKAAGVLVERFGGVVPRTLEELQELPGVGRKSANVVLNSAFGVPTIPVDTHVFRVANRTGLVKADNPLKTELALLGVVSKEFGMVAHHLLVLHGRYTCKARKPLCQECPVFDVCEYDSKQS